MTGNTTYNVIDTLIEIDGERFKRALDTVRPSICDPVRPIDGDVERFQAQERLSRPAAFTLIHAASFALATGYRSGYFAHDETQRHGG